MNQIHTLGSRKYIRQRFWLFSIVQLHCVKRVEFFLFEKNSWSYIYPVDICQILSLNAQWHFCKVWSLRSDKVQCWKLSLVFYVQRLEAIKWWWYHPKHCNNSVLWEDHFNSKRYAENTWHQYIGWSRKFL